jgi:hypothetical protein
MSPELIALQGQVERNKQVTQSTLTLIKGLGDRIEALKDDPVQIQALADEIRQNSDDLAAAVTANTPAQPS